MDHQEATTNQVVERYVLNELTPEERDAFEDHFFVCAECADAVRTGTLLAVNTQAVAREQLLHPPQAGQVVNFPARPARRAWRDWLSVAAAAILLGIFGFQNAVVIPTLRRQAAALSAPGPIEAVLLRPPARGAVPVIHTGASRHSLQIDLGAQNLRPAYQVTIRKNGGQAIAVFTAKPSIDGVLQIGWPPTMAPGDYEILVRDPDRSAADAILYQVHSET